MRSRAAFKKKIDSLRAKFSDKFNEFVDYPLNCRFLEMKGHRKELEVPHAAWPTLI
jgi:hypothetical protein